MASLEQSFGVLVNLTYFIRLHLVFEVCNKTMFMVLKKLAVSSSQIRAVPCNKEKQEPRIRKEKFILDTRKLGRSLRRLQHQVSPSSP